jgi:hypothetical protein
VGYGNEEVFMLTVEMAIICCLNICTLYRRSCPVYRCRRLHQSASLSPVTGSLALRVCLSVLLEMLVVVFFIGVGLWMLAMQVYDTAEWFTGRLYCNNVMILRMYAIDSIAIHSIEDDDEAVSI